jgi:hypothetical protein
MANCNIISMKILLLLISLFCLSANNAYSLFIGELWSESVYAKPSKNQEITGGKPGDYKGFSDDRLVYSVVSSTLSGKEYTIVTVSKETGRIVALSMVSRFKTMYHAIAVASIICEGEVSMPDTAYFPKGFRCPNKPGSSFTGRAFSIWVKPDFDEGFTLEVECMSFMHDTSQDGKKP